MSLIGTENLNAMTADSIEPASPYNAEIGELIYTAIKNNSPDIKLSWNITCPKPLKPKVKYLSLLSSIDFPVYLSLDKSY